MEIVAIVGSRNYPDLDVVAAYVRGLPRDTVVLTGMARGVDRAARAEALKRTMFVLDAPVEHDHWRAFGKAAGPMRNAIIAQVCTRLTAFWDGKSTGTQDVLRSAEMLGKPTLVILPVQAQAHVPDKPRLSPCCKDVVEAALSDGVLTGYCRNCGRQVVRLVDGIEVWEGAT